MTQASKQVEEQMTPQVVRETIDKHVDLSKALRCLYLELDASIVESLEVHVANALATHQTELLAKVREKADEIDLMLAIVQSSTEVEKTDVPMMIGNIRKALDHLTTLEESGREVVTKQIQIVEEIVRGIFLQLSDSVAGEPKNQKRIVKINFDDIKTKLIIEEIINDAARSLIQSQQEAVERWKLRAELDGLSGVLEGIQEAKTLSEKELGGRKDELIALRIEVRKKLEDLQTKKGEE